MSFHPVLREFSFHNKQIASGTLEGGRNLVSSGCCSEQELISITFDIGFTPQNKMATPLVGTNADIDLNSATATRTIKMTFMEAKDHFFPVVAFRCFSPLGTCIKAKEWLLHRLDVRKSGSPDFLRMETQELSELKNDTEGTLLLLEFAAWLNGTAKQPVSIMAILLPHDPRIRWFYTVASLTNLLNLLEKLNFISIRTTFEPGTHHHRQLFTFLSETFQRALHMPDHPNYRRAVAIKDYAPDIENEETALMRIESNEFLYFQKEGRDVSDDRYLLRLHAAERELASKLHLQCSEYLLCKRLFFKDFYKEVTRKKGDKETASAARTAHAHRTWVEKTWGWKTAQAKKLIVGWTVLGLLDQTRLLQWNNKTE